MNDSSTVSDIGTLSSAYDEMEQQSNPRTPEGRPVQQSPEQTGIQTRRPIVDSRRMLDSQDVSSVGTPSSIIYDDMSPDRQAGQWGTQAASPERGAVQQTRWTPEGRPVQQTPEQRGIQTRRPIVDSGRMEDSQDVSSVGTPSSIIHDDLSPDRQAGQWGTQAAPPERGAVQQTRWSPVADPSDVSDLGTPSSISYDDSPSAGRQAEDWGTHQAPQQRAPEYRPFQQTPEHRPVTSTPEQRPTVQRPPKVRSIYQPLEGRPVKGPQRSEATDDVRRPEVPTEPDHLVINYNPLIKLKQEPNIYILKKYIEGNFVKISSYDFLADKVAQLCIQYGPPGTYVDKYGNPGNIVFELRRILETAKKKWAMFDIPMRELGLLKGSVITARIERSKDRISEVLESAHQRAYQAEQKNEAMYVEILDLMSEIETLNAELLKANEYIKTLKGQRLYDEPIPEQQFVKELEVELNMQENLNSSLNEEILKMRKRNTELLWEIQEVEEQNRREHEKRLRELTEVVKDVELNHGIKKAVIETIERLTADPELVEKAVVDWMRAIKEAIGSKKDVLHDLSATVKALDDEVAMRQVQIQDLKDALTELDTSLNTMKKAEQNKEMELHIAEDAVKSLKIRTESMEESFKKMAQEADEMSDQYYSFAITKTPKSDPESTKKMVKSPRPLPMHPIFEDSIEEFRGSSPDYSPRYEHKSTPLSLESTPSSAGTAPSPSLDLNIPSPDVPSYLGAPGTHTLPRPPSRFAPEIPTIDPSTRSMGGVTNRIDVGKSFNMQTVHRGTSTPYSQVTRVESTVPQAGPSRMVDSPLNIKHMAEFTPDNCVTPFISKSRFGYTDPTARVLNLPPGAEFDVPTGMKKTVVLTSPRRREPLLVNIDVDPKPLTETATGEEHFICDITLDLQPGGQNFQQLSPVFTYHEPPAVTPTTARRHGLFTPRGIFRKKHFNVRRVHWPDEYVSPDLPWSPHGLPDARSPVSSLYSSPYISDTSISWEKSPDYYARDRTFDASPTAGMNRTFSRSPSPVIKGPRYGIPSPDFDSTYEESPSPVIQGPSYRSRLSGLDRTYDVSPPPVIQGPSHRRTYTRYDRTYDLSPSPVIQSPSYRSPSPGLDRTYDASPPPVIQGPSYRSPSPGPNRTYDASPPAVIQGPSYRSPSPRLDRTYDRSLSPDTQRTFDSHTNSLLSKSGSYKYDSTSGSSGSFYQSRPSGLDGTYSRSSSGSSYSRSPSPQLNRTYDRSVSPQMNRTSSRSPSPQLNRTYDPSLSPQMNQTFSRSPSPQLNRTYDHSLSPEMNQTFSRSPSPQLNVTDESPHNTGFYRSASQLDRTFE